ncbi:hypothetical protein K523DRAFT_332272 [Schizophyllum commune Tattone D]|nr:hypothetical protein K523DRAFT_332272 [Schizophyllum commune Tattone D]
MSPMPAVSRESPICQLSAPPTQPTKTQRRKPKTRTSFINKLFLFALSCLCVYSIATCSSEDNLQRPLCRSLSTYRQYVVEPYIIPPLKAAVNHPSVSPYVEKAYAAEQRVEPYVLRAYEISQPVVRKAVTLATPYAISAKHLLWDRAIVPQYHRHAVPRYNVYVQPHLDKYVVPVQQAVARYYAQAERYYGQARSFYDARLQPHVAKAVEIGQRVYVFVKPRALQAYTHVYTRLNARWQVIRPDVMRFSALYWERMTMIAELFGDLRREFVDPHVLRIWDKVVELSGGKAAPSQTTPVTQATAAEPMPETPVESVAASEAKITPTTSSSAVAGESSSSVPPPPVETVSETATSLTPSSTVVAPVVETPSASIVETASASSSSQAVTQETTSTPSSSPSAAAVVPTDVIEEEDVDQFLLDLLGETSDAKVAADEGAEANEESAADAAEVEERKRIKAQRAAEKRADITSRHAKWAAELEALIAAEEQGLAGLLAAIREGAARELRKGRTLAEGVDRSKDADATTGPKEAVDAAQAEGERLLKGLDLYLKKAAKAPESNDQARWSQVLDVVEAKFAEAMGRLQENVATWYDEVRQREAQEVLDSAAKVKALAERAQADLGIDYAWLDDVTYADWQRYHDLMRAYEKYDSDARTIANGTHPLSPEDPLVGAMSDTQDDAMTIIEGFQVRIRDLKALARDIYSAVDKKAAKAAEDVGAGATVGYVDAPVSALPIGEASDVFVNPSGTASPPEVSILPIDPSPSAPAPGVEGLDKIFVGRGAEEVKEAVARAESLGASVLSKGSSVAAEAIPTVTPDHEEL